MPPEISLRLSAALASEDVQVTLVKGGDHRLSRETDIALLIDTVARLVTSLILEFQAHTDRCDIATS